MELKNCVFGKINWFWASAKGRLVSALKVGNLMPICYLNPNWIRICTDRTRPKLNVFYYLSQYNKWKGSQLQIVGSGIAWSWSGPNTLNFVEKLYLFTAVGYCMWEHWEACFTVTPFPIFHNPFSNREWERFTFHSLFEYLVRQTVGATI